MPQVQNLAKFDANQPVYCIKAFFYGINSASIRHASDHPLRLDQIPVKFRTEEYIRQGTPTSTIPQMIAPEVKPEGLKFDVPQKAVINPIALPVDLDELGNPLPQSTPKSIRQAAKNKAKAKAEESETAKTATNQKSNTKVS
jgi:hypothetical protein